MIPTAILDVGAKFIQALVEQVNTDKSACVSIRLVNSDGTVESWIGIDERVNDLETLSAIVNVLRAVDLERFSAIYEEVKKAESSRLHS